MRSGFKLNSLSVCVLWLHLKTNKLEQKPFESFSGVQGKESLSYYSLPLSMLFAAQVDLVVPCKLYVVCRCRRESNM